MKKFSAVILAVLMLTSLLLMVGCEFGSGNKKAAWNAEAGKYEPALTMTYSYPFIGATESTLIHAGWTDDDTAFTRYARDEYGIKLKLAWNIHDGGQYLSKLENQILVGEIPDMINCYFAEDYAYKLIKLMYDYNLIAEVGQYIDEYACPELKETIEVCGEEVFYPAQFNGGIYAMPQLLGDANTNNVVYYMREDWLTEVNKEIPTNWDEFKDVLRAFKNVQAADETYGLAISLQDNGTQSNLFFNAFNVFPSYWIADDEGNVSYSNISQNMKTAIGELRDMYAEGLIYPDLTGTCFQGVVNGQVGARESSTNYVNVYATLIKNNPDADFVSFNPFSYDGSKFQLSQSTKTFRFYAASAACSNPEALIILFNMYIDLFLQSEEDMAIQEEYMYSADGSQHYYNLAPCITNIAYKDPKPTITDRVVNALQNPDKADEILETATELQVYDYCQKWLNEENDWNTRVANWYWYKMYAPDGANQLYAKLDCDKVSNAFDAYKTDTMIEKMQEINANLWAGINAIVVGDYELDQFDVLVAAWLDGGGAQITQEVNNWYQINVLGQSTGTESSEA